jgi:hypothetical protein
MVDLSDAYRSRALASEERARDASDPAIRTEWEELAIQWHLMANLAAQAKGRSALIDVA